MDQTSQEDCFSIASEEVISLDGLVCTASNSKYNGGPSTGLLHRPRKDSARPRALGLVKVLTYLQDWTSWSDRAELSTTRKKDIKQGQALVTVNPLIKSKQ